MFDSAFGGYLRWSISFLLQQFIAPIGPMFITFLALQPNMPDLFGYVVLVLSGALLGLGIQRKHPSAFRTGRFVWVLPSAVFVAVVLGDSIEGEFKKVLVRMFVLPPGDDGIGIALFTFPMLASCGYSVGMLIAHGLDGPRYCHDA